MTGTSATTSVGTLTLVIPVTVSVTGNAVTGAIGSPIVDDMAFGVTGLSATGNVGIVFIWSQIVITPDQQANWTDLTPAGAGTWTDLVPSQSANWKEVA